MTDDQLQNQHNKSPSDTDLDDQAPSLPYFETQYQEDRPVAPPAEDYPLGCEVELLDIDFAKIAQEPEHWEPFMDVIFGQPRRRVKVTRHSNDYTFVSCSDVEGFIQVGLTVYRACLGEPKVKPTKYYSEFVDHLNDEDERVTTNKLEPLPRPRNESHRQALFQTISRSDRALKVITTQDCLRSQSNSAGFHHRMFRDCSVNDKYVSSLKHSRLVGHTNSSSTFSTTEALKREANGMIRPPKQHRASKFILHMKQGTHAIGKKNYQSAIYYYNLALSEAPMEEVARVLSSRSVAYLFLSRFEDALADAKHVIDLAPKSYLGYVRVGNVLRSMHQFRDAQAYYRYAVKRDPSNMMIQKLFFENSIAMLFYSRIKRLTKIKINYDQAHMRAQIAARCPVKKGDIVFKEATSLMSPIGVTSADSIAQKDYGWMCENCGKGFLSKEKIEAHVPHLPVELMSLLIKESKVVQCTHKGCNVQYCSVDCRSRAWASHHWVECRSCGRWKDGIAQAHAYLDTFSSSGLALSQKKDFDDASLLGNGCSVTVSAVLRIAIRMLSFMMSCVWSLKDAIHVFDWLRVSPTVESQRGQISEVVQGCHQRLSSSFLQEERIMFTYELFERCYERAMSNAVFMRVTGWGDVFFRAQSLRTVLDDNPFAGSHIESGAKSPSSCTPSVSLTPQCDSSLHVLGSQRNYLDKILSISQDGTRDMHSPIIAVFELFAMTNAVNMSSATCNTKKSLLVKSGYSPESCHDPSSLKSNVRTHTSNVRIYSTVESSVRIRVQATADLEKGDVFVSAPPFHRSKPLDMSSVMKG